VHSTTIRIERPEGTVVATGIPAQYELAEALPVADEARHRDALRMQLFILGVPPVGLRRRDVVQDERNTDPLTGTNVRLRVVSVEVFLNDHIEAVCEQVIGT
jgi:hypothetical protein